MRVSAVIPNWNGLRYLERLFGSMRDQGFAEIIVVDNGSADGSPEWAESRGARTVRFKHNRGFAAAVNAGVATASGDAVAILNNDVELQPLWLQRMLDALAPDYALACGKVLSASDPARIDATFDAVCRGGTAWRCGHGSKGSPEWNRTRQVQFVPLTAALVTAEAFRSVGGLDELFESYLEDVDFGLRCAARGYRGIYVPDAVALHVGSGTLGAWNANTVRQIARNQLLLVARHYPPDVLRRFRWHVVVAQLLWGGVAVKNRRGWVWLIGKLEGLRMFRSARRAGWRGVDSVLAESEQMIRELQTRGGEDLYWRLYFGLTRP